MTNRRPIPRLRQHTAVLAACAAAAACPVGEVEGAETPQTWRVTGITLTSSRDYANPFMDVDVAVTFRHGDRTVVRPAFWDGGRTWRVRFAAPAPGEWQWTTTCSDPTDRGLHAQAGSLTARTYTGNLPLYQHGFIRVSDNKRHFAYADGAPFFWLGDTHWQMADWERLDQNNAPDARGRSQFAQLVEDRVAKGFTVYQNYFTGHLAHWWRDGQYECIDPARFKKVMDPMLDQLAERGLVIAQGIGLYQTAVVVPRKSLVRLAEYVAARYGAHPLVWFTAQEVNLPEDAKTKQPRTDLAAWAAAAKAFALANGYRHPVSGHLFPGRPTVWGQESWHDWFALQGGHTGTGVRTVDDFAFYWQQQPTKPFLETEAMYEQIICGPRKATERDVRIVAWKSLLCGSYGFTYGAAAVWLLKWDAADKRGESYNPGAWWHGGMNLPGSTQMTHLRDFFTGLEWWKLTPRFGDQQWCDFAKPERTVLASAGRDVFVVYSYDERTTLGQLRNLDPGAAYTATWFDPRRGERRAAGAAFTPTADKWDIPAKPDASDWVLLVRKAALPAMQPATR